MTYEEMVEAKKHIEALELDLRRYDDWLCVDEYLSLEDLVSAIEAIEMRIPKKPAETDAYPHRVYCSTDECGFTFAFNKELVEVMGDLLQCQYCPKCGQAIDWSDEE